MSFNSKKTQGVRQLFSGLTLGLVTIAVALTIILLAPPASSTTTASIRRTTTPGSAIFA